MGRQVGVLALQGAVAPHLNAFASLGVDAIPVKNVDELRQVHALVLPGGESTTMSMLLDRTELTQPLQERIDFGLPLFGTCAGMILCARRIVDGRSDQHSFNAIDLDVRRNAFGRQKDSFETELAVAGLSSKFPAVFIRAPIAERIGDDVEVLATINERAVLCRQESTLVAAFHPELSSDLRIHQLFLDLIP